MPETSGAQPQAQKPAAAALQAKFTQALAWHQQGLLADAERVYREILQRQPNHFDALHLLGVIALQTRDTARAAELIGKAIELNANIATAHSNLGKALHDLNRPEQALASFDKAIALEPGFAMAHNNRGNLLVGLVRPAEALVSLDKAIALEPGLAMAHNNRAIALENLKRPEEALASYDRAIALKPDYAEAYWNQSICFLLLGRFEQGWRQYEWRKKCDEPIAPRSFPQPLWLGEQDIAGKTLFIWSEQGLGDTIQFCRYGKLAQARGAKVVMSVPQPLHGLLQRTEPTIAVIGEDEVPAEFDYHCPLLSLPLAFATTLETIPAEQPYLKADETLQRKWSTRLPPKTRPRIGLVWSGRADTNKRRNRSIELERLLPILSPDADWISLQKEAGPNDLAVLRQFGRIAFFGDKLKDFSDTAALLDLMDHVITIDTSVAHLAGAMGKPVWILLPYHPDWRWLLDRDDSPWYPSARLFRQQQIGNWAGVIDRVGNELRSVVG